MSGSGRRELVALPSGVPREVDDTGLLEIIRGSGTDPFASLIDNSWSSEVDWAWVEPVQRWYP